MVSLAGSCSLTTITSCDFFSSEITREGILRTGKALSSVTWRDSSTTSVCGTPQQVRMKPAASSSGAQGLALVRRHARRRPRASCTCTSRRRRPCSRRACRCPGGSRPPGSLRPGSTLNERPLGCTVTWKGPAGAWALVMYWVSSGSLSSNDSILPSNQSPLGALPARFRRERVLIVGCGDVGLRVARALAGRVRLLALTSSPRADRELARRRHHAAARATWTGPPRWRGWPAWPRAWCTWRRRPAKATRSGGATCARGALLRALRRRSPPASLVYGSTSGVYGDCGGARVAETPAAAAAHAARPAPRRCGDGRCATSAARRMCAPASCASPASTRPTAKAARRASAC